MTSYQTAPSIDGHLLEERLKKVNGLDVYIPPLTDPAKFHPDPV